MRVFVYICYSNRVWQACTAHHIQLLYTPSIWRDEDNRFFSFRLMSRNTHTVTPEIHSQIYERTVAARSFIFTYMDMYCLPRCRYIFFLALVTCGCVPQTIYSTWLCLYCANGLYVDFKNYQRKRSKTNGGNSRRERICIDQTFIHRQHIRLYTMVRQQHTILSSCKPFDLKIREMLLLRYLSSTFNVFAFFVNALWYGCWFGKVRNGIE